MKAITSFSINTELLERVKDACFQARIPFSQYAAYALEVAPPITPELIARLGRRRRGLMEDPPPMERAPEAAE